MTKQILDLFKSIPNGINKHSEGYTITKFIKGKYVVIFIIEDKYYSWIESDKTYKNCKIHKSNGYMSFSFKLSYILSIIRKRKLNLLKKKNF